MPIFVGTAGWSIPRDLAEQCPHDGTGLERYAAKFPVVEINSSFHRPHRLSTWERWRDSVPDSFRFSVKVPKQITHAKQLVNCDDEIDQFVGQAAGLREKLAVLLVQLPPKLCFDRPVATKFFRRMMSRTTAAVAYEPRHISWFTDEADHLLSDFGVARVAADPSICEAAARPGGSPGLGYWRLHGSPIIYRSSYHDRIETYAAHLKRDHGSGRDVWCIFDNTASSAAALDAVELLEVLGHDRVGAIIQPTPSRAEPLPH